MDRERFQKIRNWQSQDTYPALVVRPVCILVMLLIADWRFLTPNRLTTIGNLFKIAAVPLILLDTTACFIWAAVSLQLGVLFDHLDGTVARYRRSFSSFGSFYDKVSDMVTWFAIVMAIAWVAYEHSGEGLLLFLAASSAYALSVRGYMKWLGVAEAEKLRWREALSDPVAAVQKRTRPPVFSTPPARSASEWVRWFAVMVLKIVQFEEADLFFWVGLGLILGELEYLIWLLAISQVIGLAVLIAVRGFEVHRVDGEVRRLAAEGAKSGHAEVSN